ncbi:MAG TPA: ankyrin repeat domain-containing protein [Elusimicrobiota bacterium]|nr:ankyrin repeat domain-containing protein [Elusimicrobiota bacterium]
MNSRIAALLACCLSAGALVGCAGATRIHSAVIGDDEPAVRALVKSGEDINATVPNRPPYLMNIFMTPLQIAAERGDARMAKLLLELGADVNRPDKSIDHWTALHYAVKENQYEVVRLLLDAGADMMVRARNGETPADLSAKRGSVAISQLFAAETARRQAKFESQAAAAEQPAPQAPAAATKANWWETGAAK